MRRRERKAAVGPTLAALALTAAVATACQQLGIAPPGSGGPAGTRVGDNLLGEPCRIAAAGPSAPAVGAQAQLDVLCGTWEQPSARIARFDGDGDPARLVAGSAWRDGLDTFAECRPPVATTILDGVPALALDCALRRGGWPYQAVATRIDGSVYLAESIPAAVPAMERAIASLSGRAEPDAPVGAVSAEIARLETRLAGRLYSAGDLQVYRDLLQLAQYHNFEGNHAEAERRYRSALALQEKVMGSAAADSFILMHIALELSNQERFAEADVVFERADALLPASLEPTDEARLISYRAIHYANQQRDADAVTAARKATELRLAMAGGYRPDLFGGTPGFGQPGAARGRSTVLVGRGDTAVGDVVQSRAVEAAMLIRAGRLDEAERALAAAVAVLDAEPRVPRRWFARIRLLQAEIAERRGDYRLAERLLRAGIDDQRALFAGAPSEASAQIALGRVLARQGRTAEALTAYRAGLDLVRANGGTLGSGDAAAFYRTALAQADATPEQRPALAREMFEASQLVRSSITAQTLAYAAARLAAGEQRVSAAIRQLQDERRRRDLLNERLTRAQADPNSLPPQIETLEREWRASDQRVAELERAVQAAAPQYNQIVETSASADSVVAALRPEEALLQVAVAPEGTMGFLVDADGVEAWAIDLDAAEVRGVVADLRRPLEEAKLAPFDTARAHDLYRRLVGPAGPRLATARHVVTVPSGPLLSLPFGILVTEPPAATGTGTATAWLARRQALTLAPSVQSFVNLRTTVKPSAATQPLVGFGDFVPSGDPEPILALRSLPDACRQDALAVATAPALPGTAAELRAVAGALGTSDAALVTGTAFTEASVKERPLADYRTVYFATHGLLPHELNCFHEPSLLTSAPTGGEGDGLLTASEIVDLDLDADLVVLSACNTGGPGGETGGESLSGLARAFFYAGARSLLVTHWQIPDEPTVDLMVATFRRSADGGVTAAEALQQSQVRLMNDPRFAHPMNWGAFTLVGDGGRVLAPQTTARLAR